MFFPLAVLAQGPNFSQFYDISMPPDAYRANCFVQDRDGFIWIGTNNGLCRFDGYSVIRHESGARQENFGINTLSIWDGHLMFVGTDNGLLVFDIETDSFLPGTFASSQTIRTLLQDGDKLLIGTDEGLIICHPEEDVLYRTREDGFSGQKLLSGKNIYSVVKTHNIYYIGARQGLFSYDPIRDETKEIVLKDVQSLFYQALLVDPDNGRIWFCNRGLGCYDPDTGESQRFTGFNLAAKTLLRIPDGRFVIGTDLGLYIFNISSGKVEGFRRNPYSMHTLSNNVVWGLLCDNRGNVWIGTDYGISLVHNQLPYQSYGIADLTELQEGNVFFTINKDSESRLWLGGNNGIILGPTGDNRTSSEWFFSEQSRNLRGISHNRIRDIFQDSRGRILVASDGGLKSYDREKVRFNSHPIVRQNGVRASNWNYRIEEDRQGNLWVSTYGDGLYEVASPDALSDGDELEVLARYGAEEGLSDSHITDFVYNSATDNIFVITNRRAIERIDCKSGKIHQIELPEPDLRPKVITSDKDACVWVACQDRILCIDGQDCSITQIPFESPVSVTCIAKVNRYLWVCTNQGIMFVSGDRRLAGAYDIDNKTFLSIFYDKEGHQVYLGTIDSYVVVNDIITETDLITNEQLKISRLQVNGSDYVSPQGKPGRFLQELSLSSKQNNLVIDLADLSYSNTLSSRISYTLDRKNAFAWKTSEAAFTDYGTNRIKLDALRPGLYSLSFFRKGIVHNSDPGNLRFRIRRPAYASNAAILAYFLLIGGLVFYGLRFIRLSRRLKNEQMEKELVQKQAEEKMIFYSGISHEFKTPLSMILAPVSQLLESPHPSDEQKRLELIRDNALKMNQLIHRTIEYDRVGSTVEESIIRTRVELISFIHTIFLVFQESEKGRNKDFIFTSSIEHLYYNLDAVKFESVINNLLSNACKFTSENESVIISISRTVKGIEIKVSDTGRGIPPEEMPFIFHRFYTSNGNVHEIDGSGIGLFLVKNYLRMHEGTVTVESTVGNGSTFTVFLPSEYILPDTQMQEETTNVDERKGLQTILIVEDNEAIADFLKELFVEQYRCVIAHNGKTGLTLCKDLLPDLVITDLMMPVMDGIMMCMALKEDEATKRIPIIVLTALEDKKYELFSLSHQIDDYVEKPFDSSIIKAKVNGLLGKRKDMEKQVRIEMMTAPKSIEATSPDEKMLAKMIDIIEEHLTDPEFNVNNLSERMGISTKQLYRKCVQLLHQKPVDYIRQVRLKKAALLLEQHKFNISEVMYMVGFSNPSYFAKCFLNEFGKTPLQFKKEHEN